MKKITFSTSKYLKFFSYGNQLRPERDWAALLLTAGIVIGISIGWNVWLFTESFSGKQIGSAPVTTSITQTAPTASTTDVQNVFKARATEVNDYQSNYHFVDPSVLGS